MAPNVFETKNYNEKGNSTRREDGELHIFITIVTITMSMILRNSYHRGFAIRIIPEVPNQSFRWLPLGSQGRRKWGVLCLEIGLLQTVRKRDK